MAQQMSSKEAARALLDPFSEPEPSAETGPGTHFGSTFAPRKPSNDSPVSNPSSNNPFKPSDRIDSARRPSTSRKDGVQTHSRNVSSASNRSSPREKFPNYRAEAFSDFDDTPNRRRSGSGGTRGSGTPPSYQEATGSGSGSGRRRTSSLTARYPGDRSHEPLNVIQRDSQKAYRSPHLKKKHMPGPDTIDRLDPAVGGRAYHHEGPYDAALLARNTSWNNAPIAALESTNREAIKATPAENIKDSLDRHVPLDGTAVIPPGSSDRFGRKYDYEEGTDMMREGTQDAGYKRWPGKEYDPEDLKGQSEPTFSLDRALRAHKIDDDGIEMADRSGIDRAYHDAERKGTLDTRDPVDIAGGEDRYNDMQRANDTDLHAQASSSSSPRRSGSLRHAGEGLKKRIGSLRHRRNGSKDE